MCLHGAFSAFIHSTPACGVPIACPSRGADNGPKHHCSLWWSCELRSQVVNGGAHQRWGFHGDVSLPHVPRPGEQPGQRAQQRTAGPGTSPTESLERSACRHWTGSTEGSLSVPGRGAWSRLWARWAWRGAGVSDPGQPPEGCLRPHPCSVWSPTRLPGFSGGVPLWGAFLLAWGLRPGPPAAPHLRPSSSSPLVQTESPCSGSTVNSRSLWKEKHSNLQLPFHKYFQVVCP